MNIIVLSSGFSNVGFVVTAVGGAAVCVTSCDSSCVELLVQFVSCSQLF